MKPLLFLSAFLLSCGYLPGAAPQCPAPDYSRLVSCQMGQTGVAIAEKDCGGYHIIDDYTTGIRYAVTPTGPVCDQYKACPVNAPVIALYCAR